jgi:WhiB family redox-sensing transcriptional regulator
MTGDYLDRMDVARVLLPLLEPDAGMEWKQLGSCREADPDMWFPERGSSVKEAKRICQGCPVRYRCLEYALADDEGFGVWGGMSERERRRHKRARQQAGLQATAPSPLRTSPPPASSCGTRPAPAHGDAVTHVMSDAPVDGGWS